MAIEKKIMAPVDFASWMINKVEMDIQYGLDFSSPRERGEISSRFQTLIDRLYTVRKLVTNCVDDESAGPILDRISELEQIISRFSKGDFSYRESLDRKRLAEAARAKRALPFRPGTRILLADYSQEAMELADELADSQVVDLAATPEPGDGFDAVVFRGYPPASVRDRFPLVPSGNLEDGWDKAAAYAQAACYVSWLLALLKPGGFCLATSSNGELVTLAEELAVSAQMAVPEKKYRGLRVAEMLRVVFPPL